MYLHRRESTFSKQNKTSIVSFYVVFDTWNIIVLSINEVKHKSNIRKMFVKVIFVKPDLKTRALKKSRLLQECLCFIPQSWHYPESYCPLALKEIALTYI